MSNPRKAISISKDKANKGVVNHELGIVGKCQVIGMEDIMLDNNQLYMTTVTCASMQGQLYRLEKEAFMKLQTQQATIWSQMMTIAAQNVRKYAESIKNMQKTVCKVNN